MRRHVLVLLACVGLVLCTSASSAARPLAATAGEASAGRVLVRFDGGASEAGLIAAVGGQRVAEIEQLGVAVLEVPDIVAALRRLRAAPGVVFAEHDGRVSVAQTTTDPYLNSSSWQLARPGFPAAWDLSTGSPETVIAVIDTGVGPHPDLGPQVPGYDFVNGDADPADDQGHGTAVAGIINAIPNNGIGISGACWSCRVMPVKAVGTSGVGSWEHVAAAIVWAVDHGADVINMSLGSPNATQTVADAVAYALAHDVVVVAAAGNQDLGLAGAPASYPGVLSVGAIDDHDARYTFSNTQGAWGSNYGPTVAVAAPGCTTTTWLGDSYVRACGTSTATPFVAALAGLLRSYNPAASGEAVATAIRVSAVAYLDFANGRIDAAAALRALPPGQAPAPPTTPPAPTPPAAPRTPGVAPKLDLGLRTSTTRAARDQLVTFTLTVKSDVKASGTLSTITLPRQLQFVSFRGPGCSGRQLVFCDLGNLRAGKPYRVTVVARLLAMGPRIVRATVRTTVGITTWASRQVVVHGR